MAGAAWYCRENEQDPTGINIEVNAENDPETRMITKLTYTYTFPEGFSEAMREGILAQADDCYVKKHLTQPPVVVVQ